MRCFVTWYAMAFVGLAKHEAIWVKLPDPASADARVRQRQLQVDCATRLLQIALCHVT